MSIRLLPKLLIDKIAAGEVIERPASVVKELVENSLDAGARRIEVELEAGGSTLIRVADDGSGMDAEDLALAFLSHSTSKLQSEQDLVGVRTMGFRGEALASIAAVSQSRLVSRTADCDSGYEVRAEGGEVAPVRACPAPAGTMAEVRSLFYNVPVRRRFLRSPATEMAYVSEALTRLALAHPEVAFSLVHNGRTVFSLPPAAGRAERIGEFFGRQIAEAIIPCTERFPEVELEAYLCPPSIDRSTGALQYSYINRRFVRERTVSHAIGEAYEGLITARRKPVWFVFLTLDPADVDVNVHPTKIEVRLRRGREVHARVLGAARQALRGARLIPQVQVSPPESGEQSARKDSIRAAVADFFAARPAPRPDSPPGAPYGGPAAGPGAAPASVTPGEAAPLAIVPGPSAPEPAPAAAYGRAFQVLDAYIVEEVPDGIQITDQHALHERILYAALREGIERGPLGSQRLLVPELVELAPAEMEAVLELQGDLGRLGLEAEPFGPTTLIVRAFPQVLGRFDGPGFFRDMFDELEGPAGARRAEGRIERLLRLMACRGAVKAGDRLSAVQIRSLLEQRPAAGGQTCPHGRPASILITRRELDRHFRRT